MFLGVKLRCACGRVSLLAALLLLTLLPGCSGVHHAPKVQPLSIAHDPSLPLFEVVVEPIHFVADVPHELAVKLCQIGGQYDSSGIECLSTKSETDMRCVNYLIQGPGTDTSALIRTGEKNFPGYSSQELTSQFVSAISGIGNIRVTEAHTASVRGMRRNHARGPYRVRAFLTELYPNIESSEQGFGPSGVLGILTLSTKMKTIRGYARFDVSISELNTNRIIDTFVATGSFSESSTSETILSGVYNSRSLDRVVMSESTRAALQDAALHVFEKLKDNRFDR